MSRLGFALKCAAKILARQDRDCPYCGNPDTCFLARKKFLVELRRCDMCRLMFRWPKDSALESDSFYQDDYHEDEVTEIPSDAQFDAALSVGFADRSQLDYTQRIASIRAVRAEGRLLDYGASWGYGVFQFRKAGYDAVGFEVSRPRSEFGGAKLGVEIVTDTANLADGSFDIVHSAHVFEHIPTPRIVLDEFHRLLKPGGAVVMVVPNCDGALARQLGVGWGPMINEKHCLALTAEFFNRNVPHHGFGTPTFASPVEDRRPERLAAAPTLDGEELLTVARRLDA